MSDLYKCVPFESLEEGEMVLAFGRHAVKWNFYLHGEPSYAFVPVDCEPERDQLYSEIDKLVAALRFIVEPLVYQDREYLYTKIAELKQADGESWAIGEVIKRVIEVGMDACKDAP